MPSGCVPGTGFKQALLVYFTVCDDRRTRLGYYRGVPVIFKISYVRPNTDVGAQRYVVNFVYAQLFEICDESFVLRDVRYKRGCCHDRYGEAFFKVFREAFEIVFEVPCVMFARQDTAAAVNTLFVVDVDLYIPELILPGYIGHLHRAFSDAPVTACA